MKDKIYAVFPEGGKTTTGTVRKGLLVSQKRGLVALGSCALGDGEYQLDKSGASGVDCPSCEGTESLLTRLDPGLRSWFPISRTEARKWRNCLAFTQKDGGHPAMCGVYLDTNHRALVATDNFRLVYWGVDFLMPRVGAMGCVVPTSKELDEMLAGGTRFEGHCLEACYIYHPDGPPRLGNSGPTTVAWVGLRRGMSHLFIEPQSLIYPDYGRATGHDVGQGELELPSAAILKSMRKDQRYVFFTASGEVGFPKKDYWITGENDVLIPELFRHSRIRLTGETVRNRTGRAVGFNIDFLLDAIPLGVKTLQAGGPGGPFWELLSQGGRVAIMPIAQN